MAGRRAAVQARQLDEHHSASLIPDRLGTTLPVGQGIAGPEMDTDDIPEFSLTPRVLSLYNANL